MSRCFPFSPSGYTRRNGSCSDALIESIKFQKEDEKINKDRKKERRREKKEKRKARKGIASHSSDGKQLKFTELDGVRAEKNNACLGKVDDHDNEQLERSDITEEHDHPVSWQELCSSDSTQSSNKRKRSKSPSSSQATGIKLRFSLRKHQETDESRLPAVSGLQDTNGSHQQLGCVTNATRDQCPGNSDSHNAKLQSSCHGAAPITNSPNDGCLTVVSGYPSFLQNWVPPSHNFEGLSDDEDWLFSSKFQEEKPVSKRVKSVAGPLQCSSPSLWSRAQYLPQVEVYALPYTVPF